MLGLEEVPRWNLEHSSNLASSGMVICLLLLTIVWGGILQEETEFNLTVLETVTVQENLCAEIPCTISYLGKDKVNKMITISWFRGDKSNLTLVATNNKSQISESFKKRFKIIGNPQNNSCSLSVKNVQKSDTGKYTLSVRKENLTHSIVFINVSDLTQKPEIQIPETLKSGVQGSLICKMPGACLGENPPIFLWTGSALSSQHPDTSTHVSSKLSFTPQPQDHGTNITCNVIFKRSRMTSERSIQLNVSYPPKKPTIQVLQGNWTVPRFLGNGSYLPVLEGELLTLTCAVDSNPAVSLNWAKGKQTVTSSQLSEAGLVSLQLHPVGLSDSGVYTCQSHPERSEVTSLMLSVQYPPKLLSSSCSWAEEGLLCTCSVQAEPAASLCWWLGDNPVQVNSSDNSLRVLSTTSGVWTNSSLSWRQKPDPALSLRCEGKNLHGAHTLSILLVPDRNTPDPKMNMKTMIVGAACGAAVTALLALGLLIVFGDPINLSPKDPSIYPQNPGGMLRLKSSPSPLPSNTTCPTSEEGPELHYARLSFQRLRPRSPQKSAYTGTEYAEIKFQK